MRKWWSELHWPTRIILLLGLGVGLGYVASIILWTAGHWSTGFLACGEMQYGINILSCCLIGPGVLATAKFMAWLVVGAAIVDTLRPIDTNRQYYRR